MSLTAMLYKAVQGFRGTGPDDSNGATGLAPYIGISATSLSHKVSPTYATANLSPDEFLQVLKLTGDHTAFFRMAFELGYAPLPMPDLEGSDCKEFTSAMTSNIKEFGEGLQAASVAFQDPSPANVNTAHKEVIDSLRANLHVLSAIDAQASANRKGSKGRK